MTELNSDFRSGYVAIVGRPNVGKSTLLNHLLGEKISITSRKPQTTQHQVLGVLTTEAAQWIFVDTPGVNHNIRKPFNRGLNKLALQVLPEVDVVLWVVEAQQWTALEADLLPQILACKKPVVVALNKVDRVKNKNQLLPELAALESRLPDVPVVPVSALQRLQLDLLQDTLKLYLPEGPLLFPKTQITDQSESFRVTEIIREKLVRQLGDELPYSLTVALEELDIKPNLVRLSAVLTVRKPAHKKIVLGRGGQKIKAVGVAAREDLERFFDRKVMLNLWVKLHRSQVSPIQASPMETHT